MKLGILTLVPYDNYGGILQGYALQTILQKNGHDVHILHTKLYNYQPKRTIIKNVIKWFIQYYLLRRRDVPCIITYRYLNYRVQYIKPFIDKWINFTKSFKNSKDIYDYIVKEKYDGFIVGSDQVWRPGLSPDLYHMFLDFLPLTDKRKRIAYAASFGVDKNEFTNKQIEICKPLLQRFDAVSVREVSGIKLCKKLFNTDAINVLDPTMLLDKEDYMNLIKNYVPQHPNIELMQYVFFFNNDENNIILKISQILGVKPTNIMTKRFLHQVYRLEQLKESVFYPVEEWIYAYSHSKFIITDSFHGTVFSIIFNVPFIVVSPVASTRFASLLSTFGLEHRLVMKSDEITNDLIKEKINWDSVNNIRKQLKDKSIKFLLTSLNANE